MGRLLILGVVALLLPAMRGSGPSSSHSMRNFYMGVSEPGQGLFQFIAVGYVDDQPINRYDSNTRRNVPQVLWMEKAGKDDPQYWERNTQILQGNEAVFRSNLQTLRERYHQQNSTGPHIVQSMYGCEVGPDGQFREGKVQDAYDGEDFICLDIKTLTWTASGPEARITTRKLDMRLDNSQRWKDYLQRTCVDWLKRYLEYGKETLQRTEAPMVRVARKKGYDGQETLVCQVHGFYPKEIDVSWMKDREDLRPETFSGGVVPNSDRTYHTWLSIEVDPEERDLYRCHVEHDGLEKPLDLAWEEPASASNWRSILGIVGALAGALMFVSAGVVALYMSRKKWKEKDCKAAPEKWEEKDCKEASEKQQIAIVHIEASRDSPQSFDSTPCGESYTGSESSKPLV